MAKASNTSKELKNKKIAILATDGVEQVEYENPVDALHNAGATTVLISPEDGEIRAWQHDKWGDTFHVDTPIANADAHDFDGLLIPGGVMNPDNLRQNQQAVDFVRSFFEQHKPVASICHGPWLLVEADVVLGRTLTSYPSIQTDIKNAGGHWVDKEVVVDSGLVTSRNPDDLDAFNAKMVEEFCEGTHEGQTTDRSSSDFESNVGRPMH